MKIAALYYTSLIAQSSTYVTAAPPIIHPSVLQLDGNVLGNLTLVAENATSHTTLGLSPPETPFHLHVPNTDMLLKVYYTSYIYDRYEHWVREALRRAFDDAYKHRRSESIADSISTSYVDWPGDPNEHGRHSTDIELIPERNLTWGMFTDCLGVTNWFVASYPEWDFSFNIEVSGVAGNLGGCSFTTR
ncbi:MAG: hypothetical protein Q9175_006144 [Cornicularia normoerica]